MIQRLSYYALIVASLAFIAVKVVLIVRGIGTGNGVNVSLLLEIGKILIALGAIGVAINLIVRESSRKISRDAGIASGAAPLLHADSAQKVNTVATDGLAQHPILATLTVVGLLLIPFGLRAMSVPGGWNAFRTNDWLLVGLAELPIVIGLIFVFTRKRCRAAKSAMH